MTPDQEQALLDYYMQIGALDPQKQKADRMLAQAKMLREQGMQQPGMQAAGRVHVAANPLQFLNTALQSGLGTYGQQQGEAAMDEYGRQRRDVLGRTRPAMTNRPGATPSAEDPFGVGGW